MMIESRMLRTDCFLGGYIGLLVLKSYKSWD